MNKTINIKYWVVVLGLMFIVPAICIYREELANRNALDLWNLIGKWFVYWAIGWRLFGAGIMQVINPAFTSETILGIKNKENQVLGKELGFSNICVGLAGIISLYIPPWRIPVAFIGGLYLGLAGVLHIKRIASQTFINEIITMISDIFLFILMSAFLLHLILI